MGAAAYTTPAATDDVDVFVIFRGESAKSLTPLSPIYEFLLPRGARVEGPYVVIGGWPVQFLPAGTDLLEDAVAMANEAKVSEQSTRIFSAEHLAAVAIQLGRAKDHVRALQLMEAPGFDRERFDALLGKYDLRKKYETLLGRFREDS